MYYGDEMDAQWNDPQAEMAAEYYSDDVNERFAGERISAGWGMAEDGGDVKNWPLNPPRPMEVCIPAGEDDATDTEESDLELLYGHPMTPDLPF